MSDGRAGGAQQLRPEHARPQPNEHEGARAPAEPLGDPILAHRSTAPGRAFRRGRATVGLASTGLVLAGALGACGSLDAKLEARHAADALKNAKVASFTLHLQDPAGELAKLTEGPDERTQVETVERSALRVTIDPAGDTTIGQLKPAGTAGDPVAALKGSGAVEIAWTQSGKDVLALRLVDGVAYARVDLAALRAATGQQLPIDQLNTPDAPPQFATLVEGVKAGKWLSLDLAGAYQKADKAGLLEAEKSQGVDPSAIDPAKATALVHDLLGVVQAQSTTTETAGKDGQITVAVSVKAKQALLAALDVLGQSRYASLVDSDGKLASSLPTDRAQISALPDTPVTGSVLMRDGHVRQASLDLASVVALGKDQQTKDTVKTAKIVVDVDDSAPALTVPAADQVVQVDPLVDLAVGTFAQMAQGGGDEGAQG